ncbi:MAG: amino acid--tRNA ligase-related protein, partial [Patescibacteria group bacterium]
MKTAVPTNKVFEHAGSSIMVRGFVQAIRVQSKIIFVIVRDINGLVQIIVSKDGATDANAAASAGENALFEIAKNLSVESVVAVSGKVKKAEQAPGGAEIDAEQIEVLSAAAPELPIPVVTKKGGEETEAPTRFDFRWIDLRKPEKALIFKVWTELERGFREFWHKNNFIQLYTPSFMNTASETGASVFKVKYFDGVAYLAQSPQFYKQMGIASGLERVFIVGPVFRAEESFTTRHLTEFTGWDFEVGYIESHHDLMDLEEGMIISGFETVKKAFENLPASAGAAQISSLEIPKQPFPRIPIVEAKKILAEKGVPSDEEHDLSPEEERAISEHVKQTHGHDFVFITDYHKSKSAFYHMRHPAEGEPSDGHGSDRSKRADLLYRGIEITTLAQ